jgi:TM2 domain-containing membrane protein YozV
MVEANKIDIYIGTMRENFDPMFIPTIKSSLEKVDDDKFILFQTIGFKSPIVAIVLSLFLGFLGIDRFYIGNVLLGVLKLLTFGGLGIWTIIDWFLIMGAAKKANQKKFIEQVYMLGNK